MQRRILVTLALLAAAQASAGAQGASSSGSTGARAKAVLGKAADTAATSAASLIADTLLGASPGLTPAALDASGQPTCAPGLVAVPAQYVAPAGVADGAGGAAIPTPGSVLVGMAKGTRSHADSASAPTADAPAAAYVCGTPEQVNAAMRSAQAGGAKPNLQSGLTTALASTQKGALVGGAVAAAPLAGSAARKLGGMFGRGAQSAESMQKDLAKGRLTMKKLRFVEGSDELGEGADEEIAKLAQAVAASEGSFALEVPAEGNADPDRALAAGRAQRVLLHLLVSGTPAERLAVRTADGSVKPGEARLSIARQPAQGTP